MIEELHKLEVPARVLLRAHEAANAYEVAYEETELTADEADG